MLRSLKKDKGEANILLIIVIIGFSAMFILLFAMAVFMSHVNALLYTVKVDMFAINRAAVIALNKDAEKKETKSISRDDYYNYFKKALQNNYTLNDEMKAGSKFIQQIDILEYEYYNSGTTDSITGETITESTLHTLIEVKVMPIVFKTHFEDIFKFKVHQDVKVQKVL